MPKQRCSNCLFFERVDGDNPTLGVCRRYPPMQPREPEPGTWLRNTFPRVVELMWCGEWQWETLPSKPLEPHKEATPWPDEKSEDL